MKRLLRVPARAVATALLVAGTIAVPLLAPPAEAALDLVGPIDPTHHYPAFYGDSSGLRLTQCLDNAPICGPLTAELPDPASPVSFPNNFPVESFYWLGETTMTTGGGGSALLVMAMEGGWLNEQVVDGEQITFNRLRIRVDVTTPGHYTVTTPFGVKQYDVVTPGTRAINDTVDVGCFAANCDFGAALGGQVGPFLFWPSGAPAGYIGDPAVDHVVTGSPFGTNFFRIDGPNIGGVGVNSIQTNLFSVMGKVAVPTGVSLAPTSLAFADTTVGAVSATQTASLVNNGTGPVTVSSVGMGGGNIGDFRIMADGCSGQTVAVGGTCTIGTRFEPSSGGVRTTTLTVASTATNSPHSVVLTGRGLAPAITVAPLQLDFGRQKVGTSSTVKSVTVTSSGNENLVISAANLSGVNPGDFVMVGDTCTGATLVPGGACGVDFIFDPTVVGARSASLTITSNAPGVPTVVPILGTGTAPATSFSPSSIDFGGVLILLGSNEQTVTLTNRGNAPLAITGWSISGTNASDFSISTKTCGATLAAGAKCTVTVRFSPTFLGSRSATLTLGSDAPAGNATTVPLFGRGTLLIL